METAAALRGVSAAVTLLRPIPPNPRSALSLSTPLHRFSRSHSTLLLLTSRASPAAAGISSPAAVTAAAESVEAPSTAPKTRLIAQNIPWDCTASDISELFGRHGTVVDVELSMYNKTNNRGLAFVTMASEADAVAALNNLNSFNLNGRVIRVDYAKSAKKLPVVTPPLQTPKFNVFVGNLSWQTRRQHLWDLFVSAPGLLSTQVMFHSNPRRPAGYGFVTFSSQEAAEAAIASFNGQLLLGRQIRLALGNLSTDSPDSNLSLDEEPEDNEVETSASGDE